MSAQPWQCSGATVYQLTDDGTQNLWSAHVNGPKSSHADDCKTAQKMAAAPDMYEALKVARECILNRSNVEYRKHGESTPLQDHYVELIAQIDAAMEKAETP